MEKFLTVKEIVKTSLNPEQEQKNLVVSSLVFFSISLVFFFQFENCDKLQGSERRQGPPQASTVTLSHLSSFLKSK